MMNASVETDWSRLRHRRKYGGHLFRALSAVVLFAAAPVAIGEVADTIADDTPTVEDARQQNRRDAAALDEDPEAQRRAQADAGIRRTPTAESDNWILDL